MDESQIYQGLLTVPGSVTYQEPRHMALHVNWGDAAIIFYADGRLELNGHPTVDAAAIAFWRAVAKWAPGGIQVTLPEGYGSQV